MATEVISQILYDVLHKLQTVPATQRHPNHTLAEVLILICLLLNKVAIRTARVANTHASIIDVKYEFLKIQKLATDYSTALEGLKKGKENIMLGLKEAQESMNFGIERLGESLDRLCEHRDGQRDEIVDKVNKCA